MCLNPSLYSPRKTSLFGNIIYWVIKKSSRLMMVNTPHKVWCEMKSLDYIWGFLANKTKIFWVACSFVCCKKKPSITENPWFCLLPALLNWCLLLLFHLSRTKIKTRTAMWKSQSGPEKTWRPKECILQLAMNEANITCEPQSIIIRPPLSLQLEAASWWVVTADKGKYSTSEQ